MSNCPSIGICQTLLPLSLSPLVSVKLSSISFHPSSGICREGEQLVVGPTDSGQFLKLTVCSIQRNRSACRVLRAGQAATLALDTFDRSLLRKVRRSNCVYLYVTQAAETELYVSVHRGLCSSVCLQFLISTYFPLFRFIVFNDCTSCVFPPRVW